MIVCIAFSLSLLGKEGVRMPALSALACSKRSSFSQSVGMRDYYINL
jgi:hypothetical protein